MRWVALSLTSLVAVLAGAAPSGAATEWLPADKEGFATAVPRQSPVWLTLQDGRASEMYFPDLGTPAVRSLELTVGGRRLSTVPSVTALADQRSLAYRQRALAAKTGWRVRQTWVTDPRRPVVLVRVAYSGERRRPLGVRLDPALANGARGDRGGRVGRALTAVDGRSALALAASRPLRDLRPRAGTAKDLRQRARTALDGSARADRITLALGFGETPRAARRAAHRSLRDGFAAVRRRYGAGWHRYLDGLAPAPAAAEPVRAHYDASLMVLRAVEDKRHPGASVASPSMPWAWGEGEIEKPSGAYHLVWSRDLYQVATAHIASGDPEAARRNLRFLLHRQQKPDGSFPQNSEVDGTEHWENLQLDEVAFPLVLAWQLGDVDARTYRRHVRPAARFLARKGPITPQERWENQEGYSPATLAASVSGLICAADIARAHGDDAAARRWEATADRWNARIERWTLTTSGPLSDAPYYLRLTKDGRPNRATRYDIGDSGPSKADQRRVVDPSFLELVRLGLRRPDDPNILSTIAVVDRALGVDTPNGQFWRRFSFDGYGERRDGGPWGIGKPDTFRTFGRAWPIFAGERGQYEVAAGDLDAARARLAAMAASANDGRLIAEQVWDGRAPTGRHGFRAGEGTFSATPLAWSHAQLIRLAWAIEHGAPVETPAIVACRYTGARCP
ncbi:MAG TPA: glycoside hydrolase family 15 protein [Capillimicrobium sp.]